ncbi:MAG: S-layer homology domain-containing protein [Butyricicoccus pullicaecorum]|nr:S-layer homology domain-containing protein [Butyricicoccus pullicaecorum]
MRKILSGLLAAALLFGLLPQVEAASTYRIDARVDKEETATVVDVKPSKVDDGDDSKIVFELEPDYMLDEIKIEDREEDEIYYVSEDGEEIELSGDTSCELQINKRKITLWINVVESDYRVTLYTEKRDDESGEDEEDEEVRLSLSAARGIRMTADTGTKPKLGDTVNITIQPDAGYQVGTITMTIEDKSVSAEPDENVIRINGRAYYISSNLDGSRVLTIRNIGQSIKVKAESIKGSVQPPDNAGSNLPQYTILTNGDVGVTVTPSGTNVPQGSEVSFRIVPQSGYAIQSITLRIGTESKTFQPNVTQVSVGGRTYGLRQNGNEVILFVTGITSPVSVSASSRQTGVTTPPVTSKPTPPQKPTQPQKPETIPQKPQTSNPVTQKPAIPVQAKADSFNPTVKKAFLQGNGNGTITPEAAITRAEASAILDRLISYQDTSKVQPSFEDIKASDWYAPAVGRLERIGAYEVEKRGTFRPNEKITRGEFIHWITQIVDGRTTVPCNYVDVSPDNAYYMAIAYGTQQGWISGYADGTFRPNAPIARSEAAHMVLRMLGWQPDEAAIASAGQVFSDMKPGYWAYNQVTAAARGLYRA